MLEEDEQTLRKLAKTCRDTDAKVRYLALHALSVGKSVSMVAEIFCVDRSSLYNWVVRWKEERNLEDKSKSGRANALTKEQKQEIRNLIEENDPKKHGLNASAWDTKELKEYFARKGCNISRGALRTTFHELGAKYATATIKYAEADLETQKEFACKFFTEADGDGNKRSYSLGMKCRLATLHARGTAGHSRRGLL